MFFHISDHMRESLGKGLSFLLAGLSGLSIIIIAIMAPATISHADSTTTITHNVYHTHSGSNGTGCYTRLVTRDDGYYTSCDGYCSYDENSGTVQPCDKCGAGAHGVGTCGKSVWVSNITRYYTLGCGKDTTTPMGSFTISYDGDTWCRKLTVTPSSTSSGMTCGEHPYTMNGVSSDTDSFTITENGDYTFAISTTDGYSDGSGAAITVTISNIDHTGPSVTAYHLDPDIWVRDGVTLTLDNVQDLQPDGTEGCGLCDSPYSFDNGESWSDNASHFYQENGDYTVMVKDALGNIGSKVINIGNIDHEGPNIRDIVWDNTRNLKDTMITVTADDKLSDGRDGVGLDEEAYSYDGGKTWTSDNTLIIEHNQTIELQVRDKLGNTTSRSVIIDSLDDRGPTVSHSLSPEGWTNGNVVISFTARDLWPDGSEGIGLAQDCYSYDNGRTWTSIGLLTATENGRYSVTVRDKNDNMTIYSVGVSGIDRVSPSVDLGCYIDEEKDVGYLSATASDDYSGIAGYEWEDSDDGSEGRTITENGTYTVTVYDKAGNSSSASVEVNGIGWHPGRRVITPTPTPSATDNEGGRRYLSRQESRLQEDTVSEKTVVTIPDEDRIASVQPAEVKTIENNHMAPWEIALITALGLLLIGIIFLLLFLLLHLVIIFAEREDGHWSFLGFRLIVKKEEHYTVDIGRELWELAETTHFELRLNRLLVKLNPGEEFYICFPEDQVRLEKLEHVVDVRV